MGNKLKIVKKQDRLPRRKFVQQIKQYLIKSLGKPAEL